MISSVRVHNAGQGLAPPFKVRASFVPFTGLIDMANEILIGEVECKTSTSSNAVVTFRFDWDLTPPALPAKYGAFDHFCVIAEIVADECNTTNHRAQNNFTILKKPAGGPVPPLLFEIANPWDEEAEVVLDLVKLHRRSPHSSADRLRPRGDVAGTL